MNATPEEVVTRYLDAYNAFDLNTLESLIDEDIELQHHNRGFKTSGRADTIALYRSTPDVIPDRQLGGRRPFVVSGDTVVVQHTLAGTPKVDVPFGPAGQPFSVDLVTVFRVRDGRVVEYEDYG